MANIFSFSLDESFLRNYADYLEQLRKMSDKPYKLTISVDLIPDGVGYEMREPPTITVEEVPEQEDTDA